MTLQDFGDKLKFPGMTGAYLHELWKLPQASSNQSQISPSDLSRHLANLNVETLVFSVNDLHCVAPSNYNPSFWNGLMITLSSQQKLLVSSIDNARACHIKEETYRPATCSRADISSWVIRTFWEALTAIICRTIVRSNLKVELA